MKVKLKRIVSIILGLVIMITMVSQPYVKVYAETATLTSLGYLGTVNIGTKTESGKWFKLYVQGNPVFCLNLGKACHSGDTYSKVSASTISGDSKDKAAALKAKAGYWYYVTENESNKAWIVAQCLIWAAEEGVTSKSELIKIIGQIKDSAGYKSKMSEQLYDSIFNTNTEITCTVTKWVSTAESRQELLEIKSGDSTPLTPKYHKLNREDWLRQRLTIYKHTEDGPGLEGVKFKLTSLNYKEMYSYSVEGKNSVSGDKDGFEIIGETNKEGLLGFRFTYRLQSKDFYYYDAEDLKNLSKSEKDKLKEELDSKGYEYAESLSKEDAYILVNDDLEQQKNYIENIYMLEEISCGNSNVSVSPEITAQSNPSEGSITKVSSNVFKVVLTGGWWRNADKTWKDSEQGMNYPGAYMISVVNQYKKAKIMLEKKDSDTKTIKAQGDAELDGAVYMLEGINGTKIYNEKGQELGTAKEYVIKDGKFESDYLKCGGEYRIMEVKPGKGYLLDQEVYTIQVDNSGNTKVYNTKKVLVDAFYESVVKGQVAITKLMSDGTTGHVPFEPDAKFQVYLASAGSYDNAKDTDRDWITTDHEGYAVTKELPYGTYIVHQTDGEKGTEFIKDFTVQIMERGKVYQYVLNDGLLKAYLRVTKKDSHTGKTVLKPNTVYQIYLVDEDGKEELVKQKFHDGSKLSITDKFVTDKSGTIMTYEPLFMGKYRIKEIESTVGYYNAKQYVDIEIKDKTYQVEYDEKGTPYNIAEAVYYNEEAYGQLTLKKQGEILGNIVIDNKSNKRFVYEKDYLQGVKFEIYAEEDIVTQDNQGTHWFEKGEKTATVIIGEGAEFAKKCGGICTYNLDETSGAVTINLPLGKYIVREKKTNYGYILGEHREWKVEFTWKNQEDAYVTDCSGVTDGDGVLEVINDREKAEISIVKKDTSADTGVADTKFGFYTKDNIYAANGRVLAEAGELLTIVTTDHKGKAKVDMDIPFMSFGYSGDSGNNNRLNSGDYYFVEEEVSDSYYPERVKIPVHIEYKDSNTPIVYIEKELLNTATVVEIDKCTLVGSKEIPGCELCVTDGAGNEIISWITGKEESVHITDNAEALGYANLRAEISGMGNIIISGLLHDWEYKLTETRTADGYVTADDIVFCLKKDSDNGNTITKVYLRNNKNLFEEAEDNKIIMRDDTTKIKFSKLASDTGKLLKGAEYKVYDCDGNEVYSFTSSSQEATMLEGVLKINEVYKFVEQKAPDGYNKAKDLEIIVRDTGEIQEFKVIDEKIQPPKEKSVEKTQVKDTPQTGVKRNMFAGIVFLMILGILCYCMLPGNYRNRYKEKNNEK